MDQMTRKQCSLTLGFALLLLAALFSLAGCENTSTSNSNVALNEMQKEAKERDTGSSFHKLAGVIDTGSGIDVVLRSPVEGVSYQYEIHFGPTHRDISRIKSLETGSYVRIKYSSEDLDPSAPKDNFTRYLTIVKVPPEDLPK